jgi:hypothetical protein
MSYGLMSFEVLIIAIPKACVDNTNFVIQHDL